MWRRREVEGLAAAVAAPSRCCQTIIITPFQTRTQITCPTGPHSGTSHILYNGLAACQTRQQEVGKDLKPHELFADILAAQDGLLHAAGIPTLAWTEPRSAKAGRPLSRMASPTSLMAKWRCSSPSGVPAGSGDTQQGLRRRCSACPRHGPMGSRSVVTRVLMPPAPVRTGGRHGTLARRSLWAGCAPGIRTGRQGRWLASGGLG